MLRLTLLSTGPKRRDETDARLEWREPQPSAAQGLPFTGWLGFEPLPAAFYGYIALTTLLYLILIQAVKIYFLRRHSLS